MQLLPLVGREAVRALALIPLGLLDPIAQRDIGDPKILRDLPLALARDPRQLDRLPAKLIWIRRSGPRHISPPGHRLWTEALRCPRNRGHSSGGVRDRVNRRSTSAGRSVRERKHSRLAAATRLRSARSHSAVRRGGTIALGLRGPADAIGKAIARRMPPASSCMTTAQPGRTSSPPRPARRLLAWQRHSEDRARRESRSSRGAPGPRTPGCRRLRQRARFAGRRFRASTITSCIGTGRTEGPLRPRSHGCRLARRSGHLVPAGTRAAPYRPNQGRHRGRSRRSRPRGCRSQRRWRRPLCGLSQFLRTRQLSQAAVSALLLPPGAAESHVTHAPSRQGERDQRPS